MCVFGCQMRADMEQETRSLTESRAEVQGVRVRNTQVLTHVTVSLEKWIMCARVVSARGDCEHSATRDYAITRTNPNPSSDGTFIVLLHTGQLWYLGTDDISWTDK
jgi:hypothetical protein